MRRQGLAAVGLDLSRPMQRVVSRKAGKRGVVVPRVLARAQAPAICFGQIRHRRVYFPGRLYPAGGYAEGGEAGPGAGRAARHWRALRPGPAFDSQPTLGRAGGAVERLWTHIAGLAGDAGLSFSVAWREDGRARVPVVLCTQAEEPA